MTDWDKFDFFKEEEKPKIRKKAETVTKKTVDKIIPAGKTVSIRKLQVVAELLGIKNFTNAGSNNKLLFEMVVKYITTMLKVSRRGKKYFVEVV